MKSVDSKSAGAGFAGPLKVLAKRPRVAAVSLAIVFFLATLWLFYPGIVTYDSILQFGEAQNGRFTTTHPPLMAAVWRVLLLSFGGGALPMLVMDQILYWASFAALALASLRTSGRRSSLFAVTAGLWPLLLSFSGVVWKDVTLAASWGLSSALMLLAGEERASSLRFWILWCSTAVLLLFGTAMRHNGFTGSIVLALALVLLLPWPRSGAILVFLSIAALSIVAVPASSRLLSAADSHPVEGLIGWDLTGISYFSGRNFRGSGEAPTNGGLACYTPRLYDNCPPVRFNSSADALSKWETAIARQPLAYLRHRALVFSMLLRFGCRECHPYIWEPGGPNLPQGLSYRPNPVRPLLGHVVALLARTPVGRPYLWLTAAIGLAALLWRRSDFPQRRTLALIALSGIVYTFGYFFAAVTDEFRYVYWPIYAVVLAGTAYLFSGRAVSRDVLRWVIAPVLLMAVADTAIQLAAPTDFIAPSMATNY